MKWAENVHSTIKDSKWSYFARRQYFLVSAVEVRVALAFDCSHPNELFLPSCPDDVRPGSGRIGTEFTGRCPRNESTYVIEITQVPARFEDLCYLGPNEGQVARRRGGGFRKSETFPSVTLRRSVEATTRWQVALKGV